MLDHNSTLDPAKALHQSPELKRRDFLYVMTGAVAAVGAAFAMWPFIDQMEPSSGVLAAGGPISVDLSGVVPGQQIVVRWRSRPVFIVNRTPPLLATLRDPALLSQLRDPHSQELQQPNYATNWSRSIKPEFLVLVGVCTHLGCIPTFTPEKGALDPSWPGGYLCHCHGSRYDLAGRVFQGVPAPYNLPVPPYHFSNATTLVLGENPPGDDFSLSSVEQI
jgi:ubiquinol-cytochrome c reductase iron-sulfur subunit